MAVRRTQPFQAVSRCVSGALQPLSPALGPGLDERVDPLSAADVFEDCLAVVIPKWQGWAQAALSKLEEASRERETA